MHVEKNIKDKTEGQILTAKSLQIIKLDQHSCMFIKNLTIIISQECLE